MVQAGEKKKEERLSKKYFEWQPGNGPREAQNPRLNKWRTMKKQ